MVPIAFTSDHIETLSELDLEYGHVARQAGITHYIRADALNAEPRFLEALSDIVASHLAGSAPTTPNYKHRCPGCANAYCRPGFNSSAKATVIRAPEDVESDVESLV